MKRYGSLTFVDGDTPLKAYERAMRFGAYHHAANVAAICGLEHELVRQAAFKAFCRYDDLGLEELALEVARQFGLILFETVPQEYVKLLQALGEVPAEIPPWAVVQAPKEIQ
jgi:hypothetical protein